MAPRTYDFSGYVTRNNLKCSDGRTIRQDAFKDCDGKVVPLVWNHNHMDPESCLGQVLLENRPDGVYGYGSFNDTSSADTAKECVRHRDITGLSIYANGLKQSRTGDVLHGNIREVSLVMAGANPGALIDDVVVHSEDADGEALIFTGEEIELYHADNSPANKEEPKMATANTDDTKTTKATKDTKSSGDKTVGEVFDELTDEQKEVVYAIIGQALIEGGSDDKEDDDMKQNVFEGDTSANTLVHSEEYMAAISDGKRYGSLRDAFLAHGIDNVEWLFPEDHVLDVPPRIIDNDQSWVSIVMNGVTHIPFSRVKSMFADLTEEDARAKGYIKGNFKKEQVFGLLKRSTSPTTVYKKQKMDRDDIIDITSFDVVAWLKSEMRVKLNEEIARAILIGDGRLSSSDDKINEQCIRPIISDDDLFTIKRQVSVRSADTSDVRAKAAIKEIIRSRKDYKGSGTPTFFTSEDMLTEMLLLEDDIGRPLYTDEAALARKLRVSKIVTVPQMEGLNGPKNGALVGIIVNLSDYTVGADKGGAVNMFDDFDIDYNQQKYLIETRCSGALTTPYSAITVEYNVTG